MSAGDTRICLQRLEAHGLIGRLPGTSQRFRAAAPDRAFAPLVRNRRDDLRAVRAGIASLTAEYRDGEGRSAAAEPVEMLESSLATRAYVQQVMDAAAKSVCAIVTDWATGFDELPAIGPGRLPPDAHRVVYPRSALACPEAIDHVAAGIAAGRPARAMDRPPCNLLIVDGALALLPVRDTRPPEPIPEHALMAVHPGGILDALTALFERTWTCAAPVTVLVDGTLAPDRRWRVPGPDELHLLELLVDGLTDEAIAGKLGVGTRTVQRHVRDLIELAGVRTRLQLIWEGTRRGWI
jgi:DNA-binding CsgD family transcriptional regulator